MLWKKSASGRFAVVFPFDLENERGQLIERVGKLQADENQGCDHQTRAKMHEGLKTKVLS
jgi:hypothetical protein